MIEQIHQFVIPAAFTVLPPAMGSTKAVALLLAIGLQESGFAHRRQLNGPAKGFFQFELGGVRGVMDHGRTVILIGDALEALCYPRTAAAVDVWPALEHNDVLAVCVARCLLWTLPDALPGPDDPASAWQQYVKAWAPGKPRPAEWRPNYAAAWGMVTERQL